MKQLPEKFISYGSYVVRNFRLSQSYDFPADIRFTVNTNKISVEEFLEISPFHLEPIPWIDNGFSTMKMTDRPDTPILRRIHYLQEPCHDTCKWISVNPGEYVLDLCAAPGESKNRIRCKAS